jgi:hypothetical protein
MIGMPAWCEVQSHVARELGEPVTAGQPLVPVRRSGMTWAARTPGAGAIVIKLRCAAISAILRRLPDPA